MDGRHPPAADGAAPAMHPKRFHLRRLRRRRGYSGNRGRNGFIERRKRITVSFFCIGNQLAQIRHFLTSQRIRGGRTGFTLTVSGKAPGVAWSRNFLLEPKNSAVIQKSEGAGSRRPLAAFYCITKRLPLQPVRKCGKYFRIFLKKLLTNLYCSGII